MVLPRFEGAPIHTRFDALQSICARRSAGGEQQPHAAAMLQAEDESGQPVEVRLAAAGRGYLDVYCWMGERMSVPEMRLSFGEGLSARILVAARPAFLMEMQFDRCCMQLLDLIYRLGEPIRYSYLDRSCLSTCTDRLCQPARLGRDASAGRAFTWEMLIRLQRQGVGLAAITLHTGLSSSRDDQVMPLIRFTPKHTRLPARLRRRSARLERAAQGHRGGHQRCRTLKPRPTGWNGAGRPRANQFTDHSRPSFTAVDALLTGCTSRRPVIWTCSAPSSIRVVCRPPIWRPSSGLPVA